MKKHVKLILLAVVVAAGLITAAAAAGRAKSLDVVGTDSVAAFGRILDAMPERVTPAGQGSDGDGIWSLSAPDGSARFVWGRKGVRLLLDAEPFLAAGLDPAKLPASHALSGGSIAITMAVSSSVPASMSATADFSTPLAAYAALVDSRRESINYHSFLDHYGVKAGGGNMFEWAKNMATNDYDGSVQDKDIVFALNPAPFAAAGADVQNIPGWLHAEVPVMSGGSVGTEWNLLKAFAY